MALKPIEKTAYRLFGGQAKKYLENKPHLDKMLVSADIKVLPEVFVATNYLYAVIAGAAMAIVTIVVYILLSILFSVPAMKPLAVLVPVITAIVGILALVVPVMLIATIESRVKAKINQRGKNIDKMLPYAVNYMAALSSAEVSPAFIFRGLATQDIYGEIRSEAEKIVLEMDVLGKDILTAIHDAIDRSPSVKWQDFLQGIITTVTSGGSLNIYFQAKSEQYVKENRVEQKGTLETLGVMGESFVTVVVAMPLFLIIILSVMAMMGGRGGETFILYAIIGFMIPASQGMFIYVISGINV